MHANQMLHHIHFLVCTSTLAMGVRQYVTGLRKSTMSCTQDSFNFGFTIIQPLALLTYRDDYNSLTSDIFQVILLNIRPLIFYLSNAIYGCLIKSRDNMAIDGFCPFISEKL